MHQNQWHIEKQLKCTEFAAPCLLNDEYALIASKSPRGHIYSFDLQTNEWFAIAKLDIEPLRHSTVIDISNQKLFLYTNTNTSTDIFFEIDIGSKSCITYKGALHGVPQGLGSESGGNVELCILNGVIHAIGGYSTCYHSVWTHNKHSDINSFIEKQIGNRPKKQSLYGHSLIALHSPPLILIFGGRDNSLFGGYLHDIWLCHVKRDMIWTKFEKTKLPHRMCYFGCIKTNDERYIILFGGKTGSGLKDEIWILSTSTWKWSKNTIKCPKKARYYAFITAANDIHLFEMSSCNHWTMKLSQLMLETDTECVETDTNYYLIKEMKSIQKKYDLLNEKVVDDEKIWNAKCNELQKCLVKANNDYKILNKKYDELTQKYERRILLDTKGFMDWTQNDIIQWISCLESGRFQKYIKSIEKHFKMENITAEFLTDLDKHDIHRFGVTQYPDKIKLLKHFKSLDINLMHKPCIIWNQNSQFGHIVI